MKLQTGQQSLGNTGTVYINILGYVRLKQTRSSNQVSTLSDLSPNEENITHSKTCSDWTAPFGVELRNSSSIPECKLNLSLSSKRMRS